MGTGCEQKFTIFLKGGSISDSLISARLVFLKETIKAFSAASSWTKGVTMGEPLNKYGLEMLLSLSFLKFRRCLSALQDWMALVSSSVSAEHKAILDNFTEFWMDEVECDL